MLTQGAPIFSQTDKKNLSQEMILNKNSETDSMNLKLGTLLFPSIDKQARLRVERNGLV